jgi:hypothetical protein
MAELTERDLRDKRRGLESLNARDASEMELQRNQMAIWRNDNRPSSIERFNKAKTKLAELDAQVNSRITEIESIGTQLTTIANTQKTKDSTKTIADKKRQLAIAEEELDRAKVASLTAEIKSLEQGTPTSNDPNIVGPDINRPDDPYGNAARARGLAVVRDPQSGKSYLSSDNPATPDYKGANQPHYVWLSDKPEFKSKLPGFTSTPNMFIDYSYKNVEAKILEDAKKSPDGVQGLFDRLYRAGLVSKSTRDNLRLDSNEFTQGLGDALNSYGKKVQRDYDVNGIKTPISFNQYLDKEYQPTGPEVDYSYKTTLRPTADSDLNRFFMDNLGTGASDEQLAEYYKELRLLEKNAFLKRTKNKNETGGTTESTSGEFIDEADKLALQRKIAGKALNGSNVDTIVKGGAKAAQDINSVLAYAKRYGISLTNQDALGYVANELKLGQKDMAKVNAKLLAVSKATYSNLSDVLSEDVSLNDLSYNYKRSMQDILELDANQIDTMDSTIQTALRNNGNKGAMNLTEFERLLKQDARWGKTKNARETATNFANNILKSFGLVA